MKRVMLYAIGVYLAFICFSLYLTTAHSGPYQGSKEEGGGFPSSAPGGITGRIPEAAKPCRQYLATCEKSCASRGDLFRFSCLGESFNPDQERYRCQCGDDALQQGTQIVHKEQEK